ncbi:MAG: PEP-CTERM sorting domain-containing protein [Sandarakinorhabdus sp.]|nr:PEP-CTERM sorting domain-containing protein [Sandarakinorhabdus sp.]
MQLPGSFAFSGEPNFRGGFVDLYGDQRTNAFAFDITGANAVPEAATWMLMIAGFGMVGAVARRRNSPVAA